ncbi:MAG: NFACT RNA binding domain-containing protein [Desulfovermiculus sp.]|nr:NFACT RNA binding domain-containing protein [Desulfovermiculus sp.]
MEANFFRFLVQDQRFHLAGRRVEKIYVPRAGAWTIKLGSKSHLMCIWGKRHHALFLSAHKPSNPSQPPAVLGWWRKRVQGRRIVESRADWPSRRLALCLDRSPSQWLILDLQAGMSLVDELESGFGQEPEWPSWEQITDNPRIFHQFPQISPPLRHTLSVMDPNTGRELLHDLQLASSPRVVNWAKTKSNREQDWLVPWAIPDHLHNRFSQVVSYTQPLPAAEDFGFSVFQGLETAQSETGTHLRRERKRLTRQLAKIAEDEERLKEMVARQEQAEVIKANLYQLDSEAHMSHIGLYDHEGRYRTQSLDPRVSVRGNMERLFKQARKGRRGLEHVARRRRETQTSLANLEAGKEPYLQEEIGPEMPNASSNKGRGDAKPPSGFTDILMYTSSDGFSILRGKNSQGNHRLLTRVARAHDLWFHAAHGPGAHVVVRRPGPTSEVPETTRQEAAGIAALRSHFSGSTKAEIICALAKHVSPIKGGRPGQVKVREILESIQVPLDTDLEERLKVT